jgi:hypothetical protein
MKRTNTIMRRCEKRVQNAMTNGKQMIHRKLTQLASKVVRKKGQDWSSKPG